MTYRWLEWVFGVVCFFVCASLVSDYTLNHFYRTGAYLGDSGEFAYLASFSTTWPIWKLPIWHGQRFHTSVFSIHVMPIFYVTSALHQTLLFIPAAAYFSLLQGLWTGLLGLAVFVAYARSHNLLLRVITALATAFCGPVLSTIGFPHVEIAIPALLLLFLALRSSGYRAGSYFSLGLCLLVREDAGLHAGAVLILLALAQRLSGVSWQSVRETELIVCVCLAYSFSALAFQHFFYPAPLSSLQHVYLGDPIWSRLTWPLVRQRLFLFLTEKAYATWPVVFLLLIAILRRNVILAAGPICVLPWMFMSITAAQDNPSVMSDYYSFPLIIAIAWPSIAFALNKTSASLQLITSVLSIGLFVSLGGNNHDDAPWRGLATPNFRAIASYEITLRKVIARGRELGSLMVDDAVASLVPESMMTDEWTN